MINDVTVIIACYNDKKYISKCVQSLYNQTFKNWKAVIVNDGSNTETEALINTLKSYKIEVLHQANQGQAAARNTGIKKADTRLIAILDSDDYLEPKYLEKVIKKANESENYKIVSTFLNVFFEEERPNEIQQFTGGKLEDFLFNNPIGVASVFYKKDWNQVGGYDERMTNGWEDWDFFIRLMALGGQSVVIPEPLYNYFKRKHSTTSRALKNRTQLYNYIFKKNAALYQKNLPHLIDFYSKEITDKENTINALKNSKSYKFGNSIMRFLSVFKKSKD